MKKIICTVILLTVMMMSISICYGQTQKESQTEFRYIATKLNAETFSHSSKGNFSYKAYLVPKETNAIDKVIITAKIKRATTGEVVLSKNFTTILNSMTMRFNASGSFDTTVKGRYLLNVVYKCYKNSKLIETVYGTTRIASY
ncbi:hypothetical protein M2140_000199 [Clostridiales Family XIII bacterium PM5-7]